GVAPPWSSLFFFSSRRRHTRFSRDWSSDVCSSDLCQGLATFVPEVNGQYEVVLNGSPRSCWVTVHALVEQEPSNEWDRNPPRWERQIIPSQPATRCGADDAQPDASDTAESSA